MTRLNLKNAALAAQLERLQHELEVVRCERDTAQEECRRRGRELDAARDEFKHAVGLKSVLHFKALKSAATRIDAVIATGAVRDAELPTELVEAWERLHCVLDVIAGSKLESAMDEYNTALKDAP